MTIAICTPLYDRPHPAFLAARAALQLPVPRSHYEIRGHPIEAARRALTEAALADPAVTHLCFIDSDMVPPPDALARLLAHGVDVASGLYFVRRWPYPPALSRRRRPDLPPSWLMDYPKNSLIEVDACGAGFLMVRRGVFEALPSGSWWDRISDPERNMTYSEDMSFCLRAAGAGFRVHADTSVVVGHVAEVVLDEATVEALQSVGKPMLGLPDQVVRS